MSSEGSQNISNNASLSSSKTTKLHNLGASALVQTMIRLLNKGSSNILAFEMKSD